MSNSTDVSHPDKERPVRTGRSFILPEIYLLLGPEMVQWQYHEEGTSNVSIYPEANS